MTIARKIRVSLGDRSYDVVVGVGLLADAAGLIGHWARGSAAILTDTHVGPLYAQQVSGSLSGAGCRCAVIEMPAGEQHKNLRTYETVMNRLLELSPPIDRRTLIVALGGGVVGDLAGFVAATALRGLNFVNLPTTLLADVDASVGGKTGLDAPAGKNLIGAFHQPRAVVIDAALLGTLPPGELQNGLAECVKHAVLTGEPLLAMLEERADEFLGCRPDALAELIARNVAVKADVVAADEREAGRRALLNFGHTLGHALETAAGYGAISHGQAVALGMTAAFDIAVRRKLATPALADRVRTLLVRLKLPVRFAELPHLPPTARDPERLSDIMRHDKKARAGSLRFVLPLEPGRMILADDVPPQDVAAAIAALAGGP